MSTRTHVLSVLSRSRTRRIALLQLQSPIRIPSHDRVAVYRPFSTSVSRSKDDMATEKSFPPFTIPQTPTPEILTAHNTAWREQLSSAHPSLFTALGQGQQPPILWIGCSDSRVPETTLLGASPGEVFSIRNIANFVDPAEKGFAAGVEYAVGVLGVQFVIVCGHTKCGGIAASLASCDALCDDPAHKPALPPNVSNYIKGIIDVGTAGAETIKAGEKAGWAEKYAEINVIEGVKKLQAMEVIQDAVKSRNLLVKGAIYDVGSGKLTFL